MPASVFPGSENPDPSTGSGQALGAPRIVVSLLTWGPDDRPKLKLNSVELSSEVARQ